MFYVSHPMAVLWRLTGLGTFVVTKTVCSKTAMTRWLSVLSVVYTVTVYMAYACLCSTFAFDRLSTYRNQSSGEDNAVTMAGAKLQILLIRDMDMVLLFVASTMVYWCPIIYRREHTCVYEDHGAILRQLFGYIGCGPSALSFVCIMDVCCWTLYAALSIALSLDVYRYAGMTPVSYAIVCIWSHYALLTGNMQFAVTVFSLRKCYRELNVRLWAGHDRLSSRGVFDLELDKVNLFKMLKYWTDMHWSITRVVTRINNLFKLRLFIFFLCGLLHLMVTPYLLSLTILNEDIDILPHIIERTIWFIIHIFRVVLMIYPCALLGDEAAKTQILLGSYLNTKIDFFDIKKIETYAQHLDVNKPEFSIYSMFIIDRQLFITLIGAVATYLVIILQLQGQS